MRELFFDVSWWPPVLVMAVGVILLIIGRRRQANGLRFAGLGIAALAIVWFALSFIVEAPRKACEKLARQMVQAAADGDWNSFDQTLDSNVDARYVGRNWRADGRQQVDETTRMIVKNSGLHTASVRAMYSTEHDSLITVAFTASIDSELTPGHPIPVDWEFDFRQSGGQWRIGEIRVLKVDDTEPEGIRQSLNKAH